MLEKNNSFREIFAAKVHKFNDPKRIGKSRNKTHTNQSKLETNHEKLSHWSTSSLYH